MRKRVKLLVFVLISSLLFALTGCGGEQPQQPSDQPSQSGTSGTTSPAPASSNEDEEGRPLVYDANGIKVYASKVESFSAGSAEYATLCLYFKLSSDNEETCYLELRNVVVNGKKRNSNTGYDDALFTLGKETVTDGEATGLDLLASDYEIATVTEANGRYIIDTSVSYDVSGEFIIELVGGVGEVDRGTFTASIPANFPEDEFRTNDKWTSTK
jgi:hypothetical protein